ncbi:MAG: glycerophosphodiester phosphodiesterase family protein [Acholeplasma sp.]|nr:glycerophosphodiester phosphodiesterase family protein [Acholeplasma sp.]
MKDILFDLPVGFIAHRGFSVIETENTNEAFLKAANKRFLGIECDIHLTKDQRFVVHHDESTKRLADCEVVIAESTLKDLRKLKLKDKESGEYETSLVIPTFEEYLTICKKHQKIAVIEMKSEFSSNDVDMMLKVIDEFNYRDKAIIISFHLNSLILLREKDEKISIQYLVSEYKEEVVETCKKYRFDVDIYYRGINKKIIDIFHDENIKINVWTVNDYEIIKDLVLKGVDYITTDGIL